MSGESKAGVGKNRKRNLLLWLLGGGFVVLAIVVFRNTDSGNETSNRSQHVPAMERAAPGSSSLKAMATPEETLIAPSNDGNDKDDSDWIVLKGKPGWTMCVGDLTGVEQQFKGKGRGWDNTMPPAGPTDWRFRSMTGQPIPVEYNFDLSRKCDTPVPLA